MDQFNLILGGVICLGIGFLIRGIYGQIKKTKIRRAG